jgi:enoyl-CoA hydratase/carnithine racemase
MSNLDQYAGDYEHIRFERRDGILQLTLHTDGGPLIWKRRPNEELERVFRTIGDDPDNKVVILTGAGDAFTPRKRVGNRRYDPYIWNKAIRTGLRVHLDFVDLEVPVISAVNGPCVVHPELPLMADIVLAAPEASFQDSPHLPERMVPGDSMQIVMPLLMGRNRANYFLMMGQELTAERALEWGLVNEIVPREKLLNRAWEIARYLAAFPPLDIRYTRILLNEELRRRLQESLRLGLALEGLAGIVQYPLTDPETVSADDRWPPVPPGSDDLRPRQNLEVIPPTP